MLVYLSHEHIISPLGVGNEVNFELIKSNHTALKMVSGIIPEKTFPIGKLPTNADFNILLTDLMHFYIDNLGLSLLNNPKTKIIISTTKGGIEDFDQSSILQNVNTVFTSLQVSNEICLISNACVSGVMGINLGSNLIRSGLYDNALVIGLDIITDFILKGFNCLFALSDSFCKPFDKNRKGINLGDCGAGIFISKEKQIGGDSSVLHLGGSSANDANHISGPSRTGEGLFQSIQKTLHQSKISSQNIDFVSAHGTATLYNDEMESIALARHKMNSIPLNSFKSFFGHTLGAAGILETNLSIQSMKNNELITSLNYEEQGTSEKLNVLTENLNKSVNAILKTSSGFGGINSTLIVSKWN
jgi:3-oxoacyl-[acyl-carrier-protein] synthase-1